MANVLGRGSAVFWVRLLTVCSVTGQRFVALSLEGLSDIFSLLQLISLFVEHPLWFFLPDPFPYAWVVLSR